MFQTLNEPQYFVQIAVASSECRLLLPTERCSSPTDSVWALAPVISERAVSKIVGRCVQLTYIKARSGNGMQILADPWTADCPVQYNARVSDDHWVELAQQKSRVSSAYQSPLKLRLCLSVTGGGSVSILKCSRLSHAAQLVFGRSAIYLLTARHKCDYCYYKEKSITKLISFGVVHKGRPQRGGGDWLRCGQMRTRGRGSECMRTSATLLVTKAYRAGIAAVLQQWTAILNFL